MTSSHSNAMATWYRKDDHPTWYGKFSRDERDKMIADDLSAGYSIPALLFSVILIGMTTMALSVLIAM